MIVKKAYDCYIEDKDCNQLIDTTMGSGTQIIGHGNELIKKVSKIIKHGTIYSIQNAYTEKVNYLLKKHINPSPKNYSQWFMNWDF